MIDQQEILRGLRFKWRSQLPMVLQTEAAECGLASLTMVAIFHGHDVDLSALRKKFSTSLKGADLGRLISFASELGFTARPLRLEVNELQQLRTPCILHWNLNHFVVLNSCSKGFAIIHDPAQGIRQLSYSEFSKSFTGVALELWPRSDFKPARLREALDIRSIVGRVYGLKRYLSLIFAIALCLEIFGLIVPFYMQWIVDQVLVSADHDLLNLLALGFCCVAVFQAIFTAGRSWSVAQLSAMLNVQWLTNLFSHMVRLPLDWFEKRHIGDIVSRFGAIQNIQQTITTKFVTSILDSILAVATMGVMIAYSGELSAIVIVGSLAYATLRWIIYGPLRRSQEEQLVQMARQQTSLLESIRGVQAIKLANAEADRASRFSNYVVQSTNSNISIQRIGITFSAINQVLFALIRVGLLWLAARQVLDGQFTAGMMIAFVTYADQFSSRAVSLIDQMVEFRMLRLYAERAADIALTPTESSDASSSTSIDDLTISFENVSFRYSESDPWVLRNCSISFTPGQYVAIAGQSGCGKTTFAKVLLGLLTPVEGKVLIGGVDIRKFGITRYRNLVGAVMQEDQLFAGSISDNIAFFESQATGLKVEAAARLAAVHEDISAMPMGYHTLVGDMGSSLSGGQKQRIILARALYRRPKILLLDEATSHLDILRERQINTAIERMKLTRIVIAHRPETIAAANIVVGFEAGQIRTLSVQPKKRSVIQAH